MKKVGLWGCAGSGVCRRRSGCHGASRVVRRVEAVGRGCRRARVHAGYVVAHGRVAEVEEAGGARRGRERRERRVDGIAGHYSETRICSFVSSLCMRRGVCASFYRLKSRLRITVQMIFFSSAHSPPPCPRHAAPVCPVVQFSYPSRTYRCLRLATRVPRASSRFLVPDSCSTLTPSSSFRLFRRSGLPCCPRDTPAADSKGI